MNDLPGLGIPLERTAICADCDILFQWDSQTTTACPKCAGSGWTNLGKLLNRKVRTDSGCWLWLGPLNRGYGSIGNRKGDRAWRAHRIVYRILVGPIPGGMDLDHLCRVRHCVNPEHLEPVSRATNIRRGDKTKLTESQTQEIKRLRASGVILQKIADTFGIAVSHTYRICSGKAWKPENTTGAASTAPATNRTN